ncbi:MAG: NHL repeat-containing protein [Candidatus Zixiibacteriota bacterium]
MFGLLLFIVLLSTLQAQRVIPGDGLYYISFCDSFPRYYACEEMCYPIEIIDTVCELIDTTRLRFSLVNETMDLVQIVRLPSEFARVELLSSGSIAHAYLTFPDYMFRDGDTLGIIVDSAFTICLPDTGDSSCINEGIYIADWYNHRIVKIDDISGTGWISYGSSGSGLGHFDGAIDVQVGPDDKIYIVDRGNNRIVRIDDMTGAGWTETPSSIGLYRPRQISFDNAGRILIADCQHNRIVRIDDMSGAGLISWGSGILNEPSAVIQGGDMKLYISDTNNNRMVRIDDLSGSGFVAYGTTGSGINQFRHPRSFFFDFENRLVIADRNNNRIVRLNDLTGSGWTTYGHAGTGIGGFQEPDGVSQDCEGNIYVGGDDRICRFDSSFTGTGWITFGSEGTGTFEFNHTVGISVDIEFF